MYNWMVGRTRALRVMRGGVQIWPGTEERVRRMAVDMSGIDGSVSGAFWQHALAYAAEQAGRVSLWIAGREYCFGRSSDLRPVVRYGLGWLDFGDDGPPLQDVRVGEVLTVSADVPERRCGVVNVVSNMSAVMEMGWPWIPDVCLHVVVHKGQKRVSAGCRFEVTGSPSGMVHIQGCAQKNGHCRGMYEGDVFAREMDVINGRVESWSNGVVAGDSDLRVKVESYNNAEIDWYVVVPGFKRDFKLRVTAIETV